MAAKDGQRAVSSSTSDGWVYNLSSKKLTLPQQSVLEKGLNFALGSEKVIIPRIIELRETLALKVFQVIKASCYPRFYIISSETWSSCPSARELASVPQPLA